MNRSKPTYEELEERLATAKSMIAAIRNEQVDAILGKKSIYMVRLKEMEDALKKSKHELVSRVRERTAELAATNAELKEKNARLEELNAELQDFAHIASHDLQEPLRKVRIFGDMLTSRSSISGDDVAVDYLKRMQKAAVRMHTLLRSLLAYSRVTTQAVPMKDTDLGRSVEIALSNLEQMIEEKNARVEIGALPTVTADRVQMIQLFQNLIANAVKFSSAAARPRVSIADVTGGPPGGACRIRVEDNGIGMAAEYLETIFLPFQRLHGKSEYDGAGMGLAICRKIVERHGGSIAVTSRPGAGTAFTITLPKRQNENSKQAQP